MALTTTEYLQTKTYSALRDRLAFSHGGPVQEGVWDAGDFKVAQRSAGANMSVDVAAGFALVSADDPGNAGLYHQQNDATVNVPQPTASHATLPRIDSLYLQVRDTTHGGDASDDPILAWATGTATSGATLDNRSGFTAIPTGAILLADVLVPAAATTMIAANIRDRRTWARGAAYQAVGLNNGDYTTTNTSFQIIGNMEFRLETTGAPLNVRTAGFAFHSSAAGTIFVAVLVDGVELARVRAPQITAGLWVPFNIDRTVTTIAAGTHLFDLAMAQAGGGSVSIVNNGAVVPSMTVTERPGQLAQNV